MMTEAAALAILTWLVSDGRMLNDWDPPPPGQFQAIIVEPV